MKWKGIKHILFSVPEKLSYREKQESTRILSVFLSIFSLLAILLFLFTSEPKLEALDIIVLSCCFLAIFTFLKIAFGKRIFDILKIFTLLIFVISLIYLGFSNPVIAKIGWLSFIGWLIYFIREIIRLMKDLKNY